MQTMPFEMGMGSHFAYDIEFKHGVYHPYQLLPSPYTIPGWSLHVKYWKRNTWHYDSLWHWAPIQIHNPTHTYSKWE